MLSLGEFLMPKRRESDEMIRTIIDYLERHARGRFNGCLPRDYLCLDCETTGFAKKDDLIVALGHCLVKDTSAKTYEACVLNWADHPLIDEEWLRNKLADCKYHMEEAGRNYHGVTVELMRKKGKKPEEAFEYYLKILEKARKQKIMYVGHQLAAFDCHRISYSMVEWIGAEWVFYQDEVLDTAAIEKACQVDMAPYEDETPFKYFNRVLGTPWAGVKFALDSHCVAKYELDEKYDLDMSKAHVNPGFDAMLCHLLMEEYREIANC